MNKPLDSDSHSLDSALSLAEDVASQWASVLPGVGEEIATIRRRFDAEGLVGALVLDCSVLEQIERSGGSDARRASYDALGTLVQELARERLAATDLVLSGEIGRNEVIVLIFRSGVDSAFFREELPSFALALNEALAGRGSRVLYPHLREAPRMPTGMAIAMRNPQFSVDTQVLRLLDVAREDAELDARHQKRGDRNSFLELLLDRRVNSVYEPIVKVSSRTVFGYEALIRGPEGTPFQSPLGLFGAAEEHDLVFELDCLCRASGLKGAVDFPSGTKLFLNILPTTIHDPNFRADRLIQTLEECKLCPSDVVFEISEQESIANFGEFREMRDYYRHLGFQFALDDTGSGYAGLEALLEITPEFIKMDRAFVSGIDQDPARQEMLRALRSVAEQTGAQIIGEGLDTLEELEMLGELGITFGQGWLFGHPTPLRAR